MHIYETGFEKVCIVHILKFLITFETSTASYSSILPSSCKDMTVAYVSISDITCCGIGCKCLVCTYVPYIIPIMRHYRCSFSEQLIFETVTKLCPGLPSFIHTVKISFQKFSFGPIKEILHKESRFWPCYFDIYLDS